MNSTLTITGWSETFENADTRKRERLKSFHAPSGCDSRGYIALVSHFPQAESMAAFGVFQALCQLSATLPRQIRGSFRHGDGTPMADSHLSALLRIDLEVLRQALQILCDERVRWCERVVQNTQSADDLPPTCQSPASHLPGLCKEKEKEKEKERERERTGTGTPPADPPEPEPKPEPMANIKAKVNALKPEWKMIPVWNYSEDHALHGGAAQQLESLTGDQWALLGRYLSARLPQGAGYWQPHSRSKFVETLPDVLAHAIRWGGKKPVKQEIDLPAHHR